MSKEKMDWQRLFIEVADIAANVWFSTHSFRWRKTMELPRKKKKAARNQIKKDYERDVNKLFANLK